MRITIFDGAEAAGPMDAWVDAVERGSPPAATTCAASGCATAPFPVQGVLRVLVKTPGRCGVRDGTEGLVRELLASHLLVVASPTSMGMTTALSRRATERMIPILHPHFEVVGGEIHHRARYAGYPRMALLYGADGCDAEDEDLLVLLYRRLATNMRTTLAFAASTSRSPEEVCHALARA
jgi:hypothetical protein